MWQHFRLDCVAKPETYAIVSTLSTFFFFQHVDENRKMVDRVAHFVARQCTRTGNLRYFFFLKYVFFFFDMSTRIGRRRQIAWRVLWLDDVAEPETYAIVSSSSTISIFSIVIIFAFFDIFVSICFLFFPVLV